MEYLKKSLCCLLSAVVLLLGGPVSLAQEAVMSSSSAGRIVIPWEGGDVVEHRYGVGEMGLRIRLGESLVEFHLRGADIDSLELEVRIEGDARSIDHGNLFTALAAAADSGLAGAAAAAVFDSTLSQWNRGTLDWIASATAGAPLLITPASQDRLFLAVSGAGRQLSRWGVPRGCLGSAGVAVGAAGSWLVCISLAAASAGASLIPCFLAGAVAYFFTVQAAIDCDTEDPCPDCPDDPGGGDGDCSGALPPCMGGCDLDPGDACACNCPGEACCDWPDTP